MATRLDLSVFQWIHSQSIEPDRLALLSIRETACAASGTYQYLEVGSHLGGSLQPHVIDPRCTAIYSIDPRPQFQPDERSSTPEQYEGNSTARMLRLLAEIPGADLAKIKTFESCSWEIAPGEIPASVDFAFIDGEHTTRAVLRDFESVRRHMAKACVIAFHDCFIVSTALLRILKTLESEKTDHRCFHYPGSAVIAIVFGSEDIALELLSSGWTAKIPITRLHGIKMWASRNIPSVRPLWRLIQKTLPSHTSQ